MRDLPPPLPPEDRTVGQLVAESIRGYGQRFWSCLPLGVPLALSDQLAVHLDWRAQPFVLWALTPLFVAAYLWGCRTVLHAAPTGTAAALGVLIWLPFPILRGLYLLPGLAWLAFMGLAVPAAMVERRSFRDALVRGRRLALVDYAHAFGSLCALAIVAGLASQVLGALLHSQSDTGLRVALFLSDLVLSPLLYLGAALLYVDQSARTMQAEPRQSRGSSLAASTSDALVSGDRAGLHPALEADAPGSADAQVEP